MKYIELNKLVAKFFTKFPFLIIIYIIVFLVIYFLSPRITHDFELKNTISPAIVSNQVVEKEVKLFTRVNNALFNSKYKDAGGQTKYKISLNKAGMVDVSFSGDSKDQVFKDAQTFINQLQIIFEALKAQNLSRNLYIEFYTNEINKLNEISNQSDKVLDANKVSLDGNMGALIAANKEVSLSKQRVDVSEKLINSQNDQDIRWMYEMKLNDVKESSYLTIQLIASFAITMFVYFFLLLFRYGQKFDK